MVGVDGLRASLSCWELEIHKGGARKNVALVSFSGKDSGCPIAFRPGRIRDQGRGRTRRRVECNRLGGGWSWGRGIRGDRSWRGVDPCGVRLVGLGRAEGVRHPANQYLGRGWPLASVSVSFVVVGVASLRPWRGWIERWTRGEKRWRWRVIDGGGRRVRMGETLPTAWRVPWRRAWPNGRRAHFGGCRHARAPRATAQRTPV